MSPGTKFCMACKARVAAPGEQGAFNMLWPAITFVLAAALLVMGVFYFTGQSQKEAIQPTAAPASPAPPVAEPTAVAAPATIPGPPNPAPRNYQAEAGAAAHIKRLFDFSTTGTAENYNSAYQDFFAASVSFYGKQTGRDEIARQKMALDQRWPERTWTVEDRNMVVRCTAGDICEVSGNAGYYFESPERGAVSRGTTSFRFSVAGAAAGNPRIISEYSKTRRM